MTRPCTCDRATEGNHTPDQCFDCWRWVNSPWWRERWTTGTPVTPIWPTPGRFSLECSLRGEPTGETRECNTCGNRTRTVPLYACPVHGVCTRDGAPVDGVKWCRTCTDKKLPETTTESVFIEFPHGLGDCVQLTAVLRHLRKHRPDWEIDVRVGPGRASLFDGLCRKAFEGATQPSGPYDRIIHLAFPESHTETKTTRCLREVFDIVPSVELLAYEVKPGPEVLTVAADYYRSLGLEPDAAGKFPVVFAHYKGNSSAARKNLPDSALVPLADRCHALGMRLVVLDLDARTDPVLADRPAVTLIRDWTFCDAAKIAALTELSTCWLGIDSGPGHVGGATSTPGVVVWTRHHPVRFYDWSMPHVLHLIPADLDRLSPRKAGRAVLDRYYRHATYHDLGADMADHVLAAGRLAPGPGNPMPDASRLRAVNFHREYYEEHKAAGLDYLGHGKWQVDYGRWVVGALGWAGGDVLDVGCACGSVALGLQKAGCRPHGVDLNNHMVSLGRTHFPTIPLYVCDAVNLHLFGAESFVGVHHNQVAEHWREELVPFILAELFRVLKPGGSVLGVFDTPELFARQNRTAEAEDPTNRCVRSLDWWRERYAAAGFVPAPDLEAALKSHPGSYLRWYDWDWLAVRKP